MALRGLLHFLLAGLLGSVSAHQDLGVLPETYCITYVSTFLVPSTIVGSEPLSSVAGVLSSATLSAAITATTETEPSDSASGEVPKSLSSEDVLGTASTQPELQTTASGPIAQPTEPGLTLLDIVLRVVQRSQDNKREQKLQARAPGGFVGTDSGSCLDAARFDLLAGSLFYDNSPIYYNGEDYKSLTGQPVRVPIRSITTTFSIDSNGFIQFLSSLLPNGEAGFCQVSDSGEVYITFTSSPPGCRPILLAVVNFQECRDQDTPSSSTDINLTTSTISEPMISVETSLTGASLTRSTFPSEITLPTDSSSVILPPASILPLSTDAPQTQPLFTSTFRFSNTSATTMNFPVPPTQSTKISFVSFETSIESTATISFPMSNSIPATSDMSTDVSIFPTLISSLETTSIETSLSTEEITSGGSGSTTSTLPSSSSIMVDPVTNSNTASQSLSISVATGTLTTTASQAISSSSDISTSDVESTAVTISDIESTTQTTSDVQSTTETTSDLSTTTTEAFTTSDIETTTTTAEETTTTTAEETTTTVPSGACGRILSAPTPIFGTGVRDDADSQVTLPFAISAFGGSGSTVYVSINGFITVNDPTGASFFSNRPLPAENIASIAILPYWDDLAITGDGQDRIEYQVSGNSGERTVTINWCVKTRDFPDAQSNQFTATFYEDDPGIALFKYYKTTEGGSSATIGGQNLDANSFVQYEFNTAGSVADKSFVRLDMNGPGSFTTGTF